MTAICGIYRLTGRVEGYRCCIHGRCWDADILVKLDCGSIAEVTPVKPVEQIQQGQER